MDPWARAAGLSLRIDRVDLDPLELSVSSGWRRHTTVVRLTGGGASGLGEDVTYEAADQRAFQARSFDLVGSWTLASFSEHLGELELFRPPPANPASRDYRRWAFESAALDLALRQAGASVADLFGRPPRPLSFVLSMGLGPEPSSEPVRRWLELDPSLGFKLDASSAWSDELCHELAGTGAVRCVDLKGYYSGTSVDQPFDPVLYERVVRWFGSAWIEDALWNEASAPILSPARGRLTWDAPIHSVADLEGLPFEPRCLNAKPSRFGTLERLFAFYRHCRERGIALYGGGQFELGPGRGQAQLLAALVSPDAPNDLAPVAFHRGEPRRALPSSPLEPRAEALGFRWRDA